MQVLLKCFFLLVASLLVQATPPDSSQPLSQFFFPFGPSVSDNVLDPNDDGATAAIALATPITFFNHTYNFVYVDNNGLLSFNAPVSEYTPTAFPASSNPIICPYWGDVDTRGNAGTGNNKLYYRETSNPAELSRANSDVLYAFNTVFSAQHLFIATWYNVGYYGEHTNKLNTFQVIVASNGVHSYVTFHYPKDSLPWTTGDASGGSNGVGGVPAQAGFDAGDHVHYYALPMSRTAMVSQLWHYSNLMPPVEGKWMFDISNEVVVAPPMMPSTCETTMPDMATTSCEAVNLASSGRALVLQFDDHGPSCVFNNHVAQH